MGNYKELSKIEIEAKLSKTSLQDRRRLFKYALETVPWQAPQLEKPKSRSHSKKAS